jgi:hypothetical protein
MAANKWLLCNKSKPKDFVVPIKASKVPLAAFFTAILSLG